MAAQGKPNHHIFWSVLCTYTTNGKEHTYVLHTYNQSYTGSLKVAKENHLWSEHPTFRARVVGVRFE